MTDRVLRIVSAGAIIWLLVVAIPAVAALRSAAADHPSHPGAGPIARAYILPTRTARPTPTRAAPITQVPSAHAIPAGSEPQQAPGPLPTAPPLQDLITPTPQPAPAEETLPANLASSVQPIRIRIPAIEVDAAVEPIGLTADHEMDVPEGWESVGWYQYGPQPGQTGNAVLAGHLDTNTGAPGVFWRLGELQAGDLIFIDGEGDVSLVFQITSLARYPYAEAPREDIFGPAQTSRLNLITCSGIWNPQDRVYDHRLVVYAHLVQDGGLVDNELVN